MNKIYDVAVNDILVSRILSFIPVRIVLSRSIPISETEIPGLFADVFPDQFFIFPDSKATNKN